MGLLTAGYWPITYWAKNYWADDYWPDYAYIALYKVFGTLSDNRTASGILSDRKPTTILGDS